MSMKLFKKIIDEVKAEPAFSQVCLTGLGETLLDPQLLDRLKYVKKRMPGMHVDLFTNGTHMNKEMADSLLKYQPKVYVSLNAANAEKRKQIMKLNDYDQVVEQIKYAQNIGLDVIIKAIAEKDLMESGEKEEFQGTWKEKAFLHLEGNWAGLTYQSRIKPVEPCIRAMNQVMILWDGRVALCCFDGEGKEILGDVNHQTVKEVFNGPKATSIRLAHHEGRRSEIPLCKDCTVI